MNKRIAIGVAIMAMVATAVQAATITNAVGGGLWSATGTWLGGVVPGAAPNSDIARITSSSTITLNSTVANPLGNVQIGRAQGAGTLIVTNGAVLNLIDTATLTVGSAGVGTFRMYGGSVTGKTFTISQTLTSTKDSSAIIHGGDINLSGELFVGKFDTGTLTMDGGSVLANKLSIGDAANTLSAGVVLTGGTMEVGSSGLVINTGGGTLTIGGTAQLILSGNKLSVIQGYVGLNDIIWSSGSSTLGATLGSGDQTWTNGAYFLHADFDSVAAPGKTIVWVDAIPEPATIGMIGLGALITLLIRRLGSR